MQRLRDDLAAVFAHGTPGQRKAVIETHVAEIKIDGNRLIPIFKIPTCNDTGSAETSTDPGVRTTHHVVELLQKYSNNPGYLSDLLTTLKVVAQDDPSEDEPPLGGTKRAPRRWWSMADRLSADDIREVVDLFQNGATLRELAAKFSVSLSSIQRILLAKGARRRPKPPG